MANYLYNGVELPALPERDKEKYPHEVMILHDRSVLGSTDDAYIKFMRSIASESYEGDDYYSDGVIYTERLSAKATRPKDSTGAFSEFGELELEDAGTFIPLRNIVWTNTDIYKPDGTLYLSASDPIPVNPAPTIDPTALLMGWQVGNRIRGGA